MTLVVYKSDWQKAADKCQERMLLEKEYQNLTNSEEKLELSQL